MTIRTHAPRVPAGVPRLPGELPVPPLENGDRLSQAEFHRRYEAMPEDCRAELVGGVVYMASPLRMPHGRADNRLQGVAFVYSAATPGVEAASNATVILDDDSEPQPDLLVRVLPEYGGRTRLDDRQYLVGPPELVVEIAHSTAAIDLHLKREDYRRTGVREYLVFCLAESRLAAFDLPGGREPTADADGIYRSREFPGLWIDVAAAFAGDAARLLAVAQQGTASPEHADFVRTLAARRAN